MDGVTVDVKKGSVKKSLNDSDEKIFAVDLPGAYSISPFTAEESVTRDYIINEKPDVIINIVDATNLSRSLFFTTQLLELGIPVVVALNKSDINEKSFVPTYLDENETVKYFGEAKPSVDTPVQLRLYNIFPWANYMLHAHCFTAIDCNTEGFAMYKTKHPVPCGAIEEVAEICDAIGDVEELNCSNPRLVAINLVGHGCILMANNVAAFEELSYEKDKSFVARKMPEVCEA